MKNNYTNSVKAILVFTIVIVTAVGLKAQVNYDFTESMTEDIIIEFDATVSAKPAWNEIYLKSNTDTADFDNLNMIWLHFGDGNIKYVPGITGLDLVESTFPYEIDQKINFQVDVSFSPKILHVLAKNDGVADYTVVLQNLDWSEGKDAEGNGNGQFSADQLDRLQTINDNILIENIKVTKKSEVKVSTFNASDIKLFPNPAGDELRIAQEDMIIDVQLFSMAGKLLSKTETVYAKQAIIDVSALVNGVYLVRVNTEKGVVSKRFIIQR
ncbi:MAG: T9SS type A sorting domain-containing protein [Bacteroidota bacterium]